jgi:two-component system sensor histidine kinase KdpD
MMRLSRAPAASRVPGLAAAGLAIALVTLGFRYVLRLHNPTIAALVYLLIVLVTATRTRLSTAVATSLVAVACLNFFFIPPVGTFTIADPQNWVAVIAFVAVSIVASNLSASVRDREQEALARRDEVARLFDLSRDVLLSTDGQKAIPQLAAFVARRFELDFVAICLPRLPDWDVYDAGAVRLTLDRGELTNAFNGAAPAGRSAADAPAPTTHRMMPADGRPVLLVPLRAGAGAVGLLAATGRAIETGTLDAVAGVAAIAIERAQFLEDRKAAELARNSEALKSALLASLGHDLRTPLTAIRVAASNLQASWLSETDRREQSDLILAEVERLNRLFQNILEMARIDAGALSADVRWVHPSEIVEAARDQVEHALRRHRLVVQADGDQLVELDPRLTASALAHILENAAQYTPVGSSVDLQASVSDNGLTIRVRDHGAGIAPADLPHLFDRFFRGSQARTHAPGTGMGLSIARGMLAVERGRIWAENCADGGALFTVAVPAGVRPAAGAAT